MLYHYNGRLNSLLFYPTQCHFSTVHNVCLPSFIILYKSRVQNYIELYHIGPCLPIIPPVPILTPPKRFVFQQHYKNLTEAIVLKLGERVKDWAKEPITFRSELCINMYFLLKMKFLCNLVYSFIFHL